MKSAQFPPQYDQIAELLKPYEAYLVGGAVRDLLLDVPVHDLDFALPEGTVPVARKIADQLGGGYYLLDEERGTARVVLGGDGKPRLLVDFTLFQGANITEDLAARDFTITSLALPVGADGSVIDPFHGVRDLEAGVIRATSDRALEDDPLRCLRAVRLAAQLEFRITPETKDQIRLHHPKLADVSSERIRDEFFRILQGPHQAAALLALSTLGMDGYLLPGKLTEGEPQTLRRLGQIWSLFLEPHDQDRAGDWFRGLLVHRLGRYREQVRAFLSEEPVPGRSFYQLSLLMPLVQGAANPAAGGSFKDRISGLALSNQEVDWLERGISAGSAFLELSSQGDLPRPLDVYRFFRVSGKAGVAGVFLGLVGEFGQQGLEQESWITRLKAARTLLEGYWERFDEWVDPPSIVDGNDIQRELQLQPGPRIGSLLEALREEQVAAGIETAADALEFLKGKLIEMDGPPV